VGILRLEEPRLQTFEREVDAASPWVLLGVEELDLGAMMDCATSRRQVQMNKEMDREKDWIVPRIADGLFLKGEGMSNLQGTEILTMKDNAQDSLITN
jgi:hypothetical protein